MRPSRWVNRAPVKSPPSSSTTTSWPARARSQAAVAPAEPEPTTQISAATAAGAACRDRSRMAPLIASPRDQRPVVADGGPRLGPIVEGQAEELAQRQRHLALDQAPLAPALEVGQALPGAEAAEGGEAALEDQRPHLEQGEAGAEVVLVPRRSE